MANSLIRRVRYYGTPECSVIDNRTIFSETYGNKRTL